MNSLILISPSKGEAFNQFFLVKIENEWKILSAIFHSLFVARTLVLFLSFSRSGLQFSAKLSSITRLVCSKDFSPLSEFFVNQD